MSDDASAYGTDDEQADRDRIEDVTEADDYPAGVPEDEDPRELDEDYTDDPAYDEASGRDG